MNGVKEALFDSPAFGASCAVWGVLINSPGPLLLALFIACLAYGAKSLQAAGSEREILPSEKPLVVCGLTFMGNLLADDFLACEYSC